MENYSLTAASGWQTLASLLIADATFKGKYNWVLFKIRNTSANTMIVKTLPGTTAPSSDSGENLTASSGVHPGFTIAASDGSVIDGAAIWLKASAGSTTFDVSFVREGK